MCSITAGQLPGNFDIFAADPFLEPSENAGRHLVYLSKSKFDIADWKRGEEEEQRKNARTTAGEPGR